MEKNRIETAVDFLKDCQSFKVDDLRLGMTDRHNMYVTGWSMYSDINNITKQIALIELNEIKLLFRRMVESSDELKGFVQNKGIEYNLALNYGMGAIGICSEQNSVITWRCELKDF